MIRNSHAILAGLLVVGATARAASGGPNALAISGDKHRRTARFRVAHFASSAAAYRAMLSQYVRPNNPNPRSLAAFRYLIHAPNGDLYFLKGIRSDRRSISNACRVGLFTMHTPRSLRILIQRMRTAKKAQAYYIVFTLIRFPRGAMTRALISAMPLMKGGRAIDNAISVLTMTHNRAAIQFLNHLMQTNASLRLIAANSLDSAGSDLAVAESVKIIDNPRTSVGAKEGLIDNLTDDPRRAAVGALIGLLPRLQPSKIPAQFWHPVYLKLILQRMRSYFRASKIGISPLGGGLPLAPETVDDWQRWWKVARTRFNTHMRLRAVPLPRGKIFPKSRYGYNPRLMRLKIKLNAKRYRIGDPIQLCLTFRNTSKKAVLVQCPETIGGFPSAIAFGVRITHAKTGKTLFESTPTSSAPGMSSRTAPPLPYRTMPAHAAYQQIRCLQSVLYGPKWPLPRCPMPIPRGRYKLVLRFVPKVFGVKRPGPIWLTGPWRSNTVAFTIFGKHGRSPKSLARLIAKDVDDPTLVADLGRHHSHPRRNVFAAEALFEYGDVRLADFLLDRDMFARTEPGWWAWRPFPGYK